MKRIIKKLMMFVLLIIVEVCIFYCIRNIRPVNVRGYYMIWSFIWLLFLYFSISDISQAAEVRGEGLRGNTFFRNFTTIQAEKEYAKKNRTRRKNYFTFSSLVFLLLFLINLIGYIFMA